MAVAAGGGGGRSFPVYIDYISRNADKAINDLNKVSAAATNVGKSSKTVDQTATSMQKFTGITDGAAVASSNLSRGVHSAEANLKGTGQQAVVTSRGMVAMNTSMDRAGTGAGTLAKNTGKASTAFAAFRNSGRGAQFAMIGLGGSINEAIFMTQSLMEQQGKQAAAQAEVDRLIAEGAQNTSAYTHAQNDLADATRGASFTFRIFLQSWLDNITFGGMLLSQLPKVINEYRRLRTESAAAGTAMATQGGMIQRLRGLFSSLTQSVLTVPPAATATATSFDAISRTATGAGAAVTKTATAAASTASAFTATAQSATGITSSFGTATTATATFNSAVRAVGPAAAVATASTLPLAAGMKLVDVTSKSIVPSVGGANGAIKSLGATNVVTTATFPGLIAGMRAFGHASLVFITSPIGIILTATAALITGLIALKQNWGGSADAAYDFGQSMKPVHEQLKGMNGALFGLIPDLEKTSKGLGIISPEARKTEEAVKAAKEEFDSLAPAVQSAMAALTGYGRTAEEVNQIVTSIIQETGDAAMQVSDQFSVAFDIAIKEFERLAAAGQDTKLAQLWVSSLDIMRTKTMDAFNDMNAAATKGGQGFEDRLQGMLTEANKMPVALSQLPVGVEDWVQTIGQELEKAKELMQLSADDVLSIMQQIQTGGKQAFEIPELQKLPAEVRTNLLPALQATMDHLEQLRAQGKAGEVDFARVMLAIQQAYASAQFGFEGATEAADELTNAENTAAMAAERRATAAEYETDALMGLNLVSRGLIQSNQEIVLGIQEQTQAFGEYGVMIAAQASGLQTWRDAQAEAYFSIVETATALGFQGDAAKANVVAMLDHIAVTERQNEINQTAVEGFFSLSTEQRALIDSSGQLAERMGQVALAAEDVSVADAKVIAEQVKLNDENQKAVETYLNLDAAQQQALATMGVTPGVIQQVIDGTLTLDEAMIQSIESQGKAAEAVDAHKEAISEMLPILQEYADKLGLVGLTAETVGPVQQAITEQLGELGPMMQSATQETIAFVAEQGRLGDVAGMTVEELINFVATMELTGETAEQEAERHAAAAKALADAWEADLERAVQAWETTSDQLKSAAEDIGDDIGDAGAEAATKFTDEFLGKFVPAQLVEEAFDKNIDIEDVIDDIQDEADDALDDGLISEMTMDQAIQPMIDALEEIPGENEKAMGEAIAVWRHYSQNLRPILVGGIHEVGREAVSAFETGVFQPLQTALESGGGSGVWGGLITNFTDVVNALPPEYDRMKGDFLKTMQLMGGDARAQINAILPILRELNPEWAAIIEQMDQDGDGIKDIFDNDVKTPAEQARDALIDVWIAVFDAWAMVDPAFQRAADSLRAFKDEAVLTANAAATAGVSTDLFRQEVESLAGAFGMTISEATNLRTQFDGFNTATGAGVNMSNQFKTALENMNGATRQEAIDMFEAATNTDLFADGIETAGNNSATATGSIEGIAGAMGGVAASTREATQAVADFAQVLSSHDFSAGPLAVPDLLGGEKPDFQGGFGEAAEAQQALAGGGGGGTGQFDPTPLNDYITKLTELQTKVQEVIPAIELLWTNHFTNTTAQMTAFINGPILLLAQSYTAFQVNVIPILQQMELAWTNHLMNNGAQITAFIAGPLTLLSQAYMLYQTNVIPILAAMELAWTNHLANNGAQITAFITGPLTLLSGAYTLFQTNVPQILATVELAWTNHLANNGQQIGAFISGPIAGYINVMPLVAGAVHSNLENANQNWSSHADHVGNMASDIAGHLDQLERDVARVMGNIAAAMGIAEQAARDLQSAINALQSKTITVTTNYRTTGATPAASGYDGIVRGPQLFLAGEEGPERVKITPLSSSGGGGGSGMAERVGGILHAAKGADMIVGAKLDAKAISNFAGERGMRLDEFKESEEGKQIDVEVRKVYKSGWIDKDDWKDFGKEYGYRISDFDKKKNGKLADIMFKRMKGVRFQEKDLDWDEERGEPSRKTADWGQTRAGGVAADQDAAAGGGGGGGAVGTVMGPQLGMRATSRGGGGGGGGGGSLSYDSRSRGETTVHTTINLSLNVDKRNFGKLVQEVTTEGYNTTK